MRRGGSSLPVPDAIDRGVMPRAWTDADVEPAPAFLSHAYNHDFHILRQAARTHFEKPFLYLLFGTARAMLVDTGAPGVDVAGEVQRLTATRSDALPLVVAHTHGHSDHVAGDRPVRRDARRDAGRNRHRRGEPLLRHRRMARRDRVDRPGRPADRRHPDPGPRTRVGGVLRSPDGHPADRRPALPGPPLRARRDGVPRQRETPRVVHADTPGGAHPRRAHREHPHALPRLPGGHRAPAGRARARTRSGSPARTGRHPRRDGRAHRTQPSAATSRSGPLPARPRRPSKRAPRFRTTRRACGPPLPGRGDAV